MNHFDNEFDKIDPNLKTAWVGALRSGLYKKYAGQLKYEGRSGCRYCALGVLAVIRGMPINESGSQVVDDSGEGVGYQPFYDLIGERNADYVWRISDKKLDVDDFDDVADWIEEHL